MGARPVLLRFALLAFSSVLIIINPSSQAPPDRESRYALGAPRRAIRGTLIALWQGAPRQTGGGTAYRN
jgi:hypothetical protein